MELMGLYRAVRTRHCTLRMTLPWTLRDDSVNTAVLYFDRSAREQYFRNLVRPYYYSTGTKVHEI